MTLPHIRESAELSPRAFLRLLRVAAGIPPMPVDSRALRRDGLVNTAGELTLKAYTTLPRMVDHYGVPPYFLSDDYWEGEDAAERERHMAIRAKYAGVSS